MAEFQLDHETQDGRQLAASAEVCRPELLLPGQVELARRAFEKSLGGLAMLFPACLYLPAEIRFAGGASLRLVSTDLAEPFAGAPPDGRSVLVLTAEITLRESAATISLMVPSVLVRLASEQVRESITVAAAANRRALLDALDAASLEVEAVLPAGDIRIRDLLRLKPGSILALPCQADTPIEGHVNGVAKLQGELVNSGKSVGFQVWSWPATGDPSEGSLQ